MRKAIVALAAGSFALYVAAVLSTLHIAKRPVFETVVPKSSTAPMVLDGPSQDSTSGPAREPGEAQREIDAIANFSVTSSDGKVVGRVVGVTQGSDGRTKSILVESGGFLGLGSRFVLIPASQFRVRADGIRIELSSRELEQLPEVRRAR